MKFKGTKGPWVRCKQEIFGGNKYVSFACNSLMDEKIGDKEALANALLISKAPEMLEMLKSFVSDFDNGLIEDFQIPRDRFEKLIKEATEL